MGFFRIFYYLKRILYKIPKKILIYLLIFVIYFVFVFSPSSHASQIDVNNLPNADIVQLYKLEIDRNFAIALTRTLDNYKQYGNIDGNMQTFFRLATSNNNYAIGCYSYNYSNLYFSKNGVYLNDQPNVVTCVFVDKSFYDNDDVVVIPGTRNSSFASSRSLSASDFHGATIARIFSSGTAIYGSVNYDVVLIDAFMNYIPVQFYDIMKSLGDGSFNLTTIDETLNDISEKLDETNEQLEQMNEFFNSDTTPTITNNDLPSDNLIDITSSGFDGIFTKIYNKTTNGQSEYIQVTIPYMNYTFYVTSDFLSDLIYNQSFIQGYTLRTFIQLLWSFFIFRYIVLDVYKYINDFKNGNISKTDTNIKADML